MKPLSKITLFAVAAAALCGCGTMKDTTRFNDLPTHYWNSLAAGLPAASPVSPSARAAANQAGGSAFGAVEADGCAKSGCGPAPADGATAFGAAPTASGSASRESDAEAK